MSELDPFGKDVWDRFLDLLQYRSESSTDSDVKSRLQSAGIDMKPAYRRLHQMVAEKKARMALAEARASRVSLVDGLKDTVAKKVENVREGVRTLIDQLFTGAELSANHHKLEKIASDEDLQSMMDDLTRLAQLRQRKKHEQPPQ